ncbi:molybdate ABC transporter substrate-binding protein [Thalassospira sp. MA62]|nr:molybdate ABC transporter substrate-binding protein [Thalassospira sp. MA62]
MKRHILLLIAATIAGFCAGSPPASAGELTAAVAANFTDATRDIVKAFEQETGHSVKVSFGSTGKLYSQIENGAPFDVFLAADTKRAQMAAENDLAVGGSRFTYAKGKLGLWSQTANLFSDGETYLKDGGFDHIALANPKTAPYGAAAQEVMTNLGVLDAMKGKLVQGDSISQTFQFAATSSVDAAFIALSQAKAWTGDAGTLWEIPDTLYAPIIQQAVLLTTAKDNAAAQDFIAFLKGDTARKIIVDYGYGVE